MRNFAKKYSFELDSSLSRSLFRLSEAPVPATPLLPIIALSLAVASFMTGITLFTRSLKSSNTSFAAKMGGLEKGS